MKKPASTNPWDWMQPHDIARFGEITSAIPRSRSAGAVP